MVGCPSARHPRTHALAIRKVGVASKLIVILDHANRTNDTTFVLQELLHLGAQNAALPLLYNPEVAKACNEVDFRETVEEPDGETRTCC